MDGKEQPFCFGSGHRRAEQLPPQQPVFPIPNPYVNPNFVIQQQILNILSLLNPFVANPNTLPQLPQMVPNVDIPVQMAPNNGSNMWGVPQNHVKARDEMIERVDKAVKGAWAELLAANENVSGWRVSQAALWIVKGKSWEDLGFQMKKVPSLNQLFAMEGKINTFINCFVAVKKIATLHDLEVAICESEGIERFEELELGPIVRHPLAVHYFSLSSNVTEVYRIKTEDIISYLYEFINLHNNRELEVDTFLDFITQKKHATSRERLCIRIQNFRSYVDHIKQVMQSEDKLLEESSEKIRMKYHRSKIQTEFSERKKQKVMQSEDKLLNESSEKIRIKYNTSKSQPNYSERQKEIDDHFSSVSNPVKFFSSARAQYCGKHIRFASSGSEDDDSEGKSNPVVEDADRNYSMPVANIDVSSCPYPSASEEISRMGLRSVDSSTYFPSGGIKPSADNGLPQRKKGSASGLSSPCKHSEKEKYNARHKRKKAHDEFAQSPESLKIFIRTWREACKRNSAEQVLENMLGFYKLKKKKKRKAIQLFSKYPFVGLLYAAVTCIKFGMPDSDANSEIFSQRDMDDRSLVSTDVGGGKPTTKATVMTAGNPKQKPAEANQTNASILLESEIPDSRSKTLGNVIASHMNAVVDSIDVMTPDGMNCASNGSLKDQGFLTGKLGEFIAYDYFIGEEDEATVKWVNESNESGLPYDIIISDKSRTEYIEVKATKTASKIWFFISAREWEFAFEKGDSFSIAHVVLADNNMAKITIYKNPATLWLLGKMKLAALPA